MKESHPECPVVRQLAAYNARDLDAFVACYTEDVAVWGYPDVLRSRGRAALRTAYGELFEAYPDLHAALASRIRLGETVIDEERVVRGGKSFRAVAIYRVLDGLIAEVRFIV